MCLQGCMCAGVEMWVTHGPEWSWPSGGFSSTRPGPGLLQRGRKTGTLDQESVHTDDTKTVITLGKHTLLIKTIYYNI